MRCVSVDFLQPRRCRDSASIRHSATVACSTSSTSVGKRRRVESPFRTSPGLYVANIGYWLHIDKEGWHQGVHWKKNNSRCRVYSKSISDKNVQICYNEVSTPDLVDAELLEHHPVISGEVGAGAGEKRAAEVVTSTDMMSMAMAEENPLLDNMVEMTLSGTTVSSSTVPPSPRAFKTGSVGIIDVEGSQSTSTAPKVRSRTGGKRKTTVESVLKLWVFSPPFSLATSL